MASGYIPTDTETIFQNIAAIYANSKAGAITFTGSGVVMLVLDGETFWQILAKTYLVNWVHVLAVATILILGVLVQFYMEHKQGIRGARLFSRAAISFMSRAIVYGLWLIIGIVISAMVREQSPDVAAWFLLGSFLSVAVVEAAVVMESAGTPIKLWFHALRAARDVIETGDGLDDLQDAAEAINQGRSGVLGTARPKTKEDQPPSHDEKA